MIDNPFGKEAHDHNAPDHSGIMGHECPDWDFLYICKDCSEFEMCTCANLIHECETGSQS